MRRRSPHVSLSRTHRTARAVPAGGLGFPTRGVTAGGPGTSRCRLGWSPGYPGARRTTLRRGQTRGSSVLIRRPELPAHRPPTAGPIHQRSSRRCLVVLPDTLSDSFVGCCLLTVFTAACPHTRARAVAGSLPSGNRLPTDLRAPPSGFLTPSTASTRDGRHRVAGGPGLEVRRVSCARSRLSSGFPVRSVRAPCAFPATLLAPFEEPAMHRLSSVDRRSIAQP